MDRFDLVGALPPEASATVLEASAGTGKTFALAGLVTRYLAESGVPLEQMLLVTVNRNASRELRERVRDQIVQAIAALEGRVPPGNDLVGHLVRADDDERDLRRARLRDALANFDAATSATRRPPTPAGRVWARRRISPSACGQARLPRTGSESCTTTWWSTTSTTCMNAPFSNW